MIKITIETDGKKVYDSFEHENTTLVENSLVVRRLEEIKLKLLDEFEYESQFEVNKEDKENGHV